MRKFLASSPWLPRLGLCALALVLSFFGWWMALAAYPHTQTGDGQFFHQMVEAMRVSILRYHEMPLWNPYQCGGIPLWDNPQGISGAPLLWLLMPFGTTRGNELWYILHSAMGFVCMWLFARHELKLSYGAALVASVSFAFAGAHNNHLTGGHLVWVSFLYLPLGLLLWRRAENDARFAVGLGILAAWMMHEGGTYPLPYMALLLGAETLTRLRSLRRLRDIAKAAGIVILVGFGLGASRFLPVIDQLRWHKRSLGGEHDAMQWSTFVDVFLARDHGRDVRGQEYVWTEFADYMGPLVLTLAVLGIVLGGLQTIWMLPLLLVAFLTMLGHFAPWSPASILKGYIYPFKQMRVPSRFDAIVTVFLPAYAGIAIDRISALAGRWRTSMPFSDKLRVGVLGLGLIGAGDIMSVGITFGGQFFTDPPAKAVEASPRLYLEGDGMAAYIDQPAQNRGRLECWEEWAFERDAPLWKGDVPQARAVDNAATVRQVTRTQNKFIIDVHADRPALLAINSNYDRGWRASVGTAERMGKQLSVRIPAGDHHLVVSYWPHGLTLGLVLTFLTMLAVAYYFFRHHRRLRPAQATGPGPDRNAP
jgi:hypothetical protein